LAPNVTDRVSRGFEAPAPNFVYGIPGPAVEQAGGSNVRLWFASARQPTKKSGRRRTARPPRDPV